MSEFMNDGRTGRPLIETVANFLRHMNLDNHTEQAEETPSAEEKSDMAKKRIKRRITIDGVTRWATGANEQEYAECVARLMAGQKDDNPPPAKKHEFNAYAWNWFNVFSKPNVSKTTAITYERQLRYYICPAFEGMMVEDITPTDVQRMFNNMDAEKKKAKSTKDKCRTVLNMIFQQAMEEDIIAKNPLASKTIRIKGNPSKETMPYTVEQMQYIVHHIDDIRKPMDRMYVALHALHPLRPEEVFGLKWEDIDLNEDLIHVRNTVTHPDRNQPVFEVKTKTVASTRVIPLVPQIKAYLTGGKPEDFVLSGSMPISYQAVKKMRERIQRDIGFEEEITPSRFRTTVLTDIYDRTKDVKLVQSAAGHTTAAMTMKHYVKGRGTNNIAAEAIATAYGLR